MKSTLSFCVTLLFAVPLMSHAMGPGPVLPAATSFKVGQLSLTSLSDTEYVLPNDGKIFGADQGANAVAAVLQVAKAPADVITLPVDALLVRDGAHVVLIDTGLGPKMNGALMASLRLAGVSSTEITDVLITHPHPDHIGGLVTLDGHSAFPKAIIRFSAVDWKDLGTHADQTELVSAIRAQVQTFEPGAVVVSSIQSVSLPGHSPGHVGYRITSGAAALLDIGDVAHSSVISLARPNWVMGFDQDVEEAKSTRTKLLRQLAKSGQMIFAPHFPYPGVGTIIRAPGNNYQWIATSMSNKY